MRGRRGSFISIGRVLPGGREDSAEGKAEPDELAAPGRRPADNEDDNACVVTFRSVEMRDLRNAGSRFLHLLEVTRTVYREAGVLIVV